MKKGKDKKNRSFDSKSNPPSPGERRSGNSPKRSRTDANFSMHGGENNLDESSSIMECANVDMVASQVTIGSSSPPSSIFTRNNNRMEFINSQKNNRYSASNHPPFLVHIESTDGNIGNVHPMSLGKALADHFPTILSIRRLGKNIISVIFKFSFDANQFVQSGHLLPENWIPYIPNYKIIRTGVIRGVDLSLSYDEILRGIKWKGRPLEIKSIERLKYRDIRNNNEVKLSSSVKIEFISNLLPEFITIWSVRSRVRPFVNRVRKCINCLRWGHSSGFCRGSPSCPRCRECHESETCPRDVFMCLDCKQSHAPFDKGCSTYLNYELANLVMAYCNVSQYVAKKLIKSNNIVSCDQVEGVLNPQPIWPGIMNSFLTLMLLKLVPPLR